MPRQSPWSIPGAQTRLEPPYGKKIREWVSMYNGFIEYRPESEGFYIKRHSYDKSYLFAGSQTTKKQITMFLKGE